MTSRPGASNELAPTLLHYKDLARAEVFYRDVMGFPLVIDQQGLRVWRSRGLPGGDPDRLAARCLKV